MMNAQSPLGAQVDQTILHERLAHLVSVIALRCPTCRVRLNHNDKTMLSLRGNRQGGSVVSLHVGLLHYPDALEDLPAWIASHGRRSTPRLRETLQTVWREQRQQEIIKHETPFPVLEPVSVPFDLTNALRFVHGAWFAHLSLPEIRWGRQSPRRILSSIRFACYRSRPKPVIVVNPRLAQPWVAKIFAEHVLYHELCHHAQAHAPLRGESPHSQRFRRWESQYPHHALAAEWERRHLERFLHG